MSKETLVRVRFPPAFSIRRKIGSYAFTVHNTSRLTIDTGYSAQDISTQTKVMMMGFRLQTSPWGKSDWAAAATEGDIFISWESSALNSYSGPLADFAGMPGLGVSVGSRHAVSSVTMGYLTRALVSGTNQLQSLPSQQPTFLWLNGKNCSEFQKKPELRTDCHPLNRSVASAKVPAGQWLERIAGLGRAGD